jgi:hypothetical protein
MRRQKTLTNEKSGGGTPLALCSAFILLASFCTVPTAFAGGKPHRFQIVEVFDRSDTLAATSEFDTAFRRGIDRSGKDADVYREFLDASVGPQSLQTPLRSPRTISGENMRA